jgi:protein tyrosine phosphatase
VLLELCIDCISRYSAHKYVCIFVELSSYTYECFLFSAGVGRTGVFVTLSIVLERMRYEGVVDMYQTVKVLRSQRPSMVQNEVTRFIQCSDSTHNSCIEFIICRLIIEL